MTERQFCIHCARVYLAPSRHFTGRHRGWSFRLLDWAGQMRRRAMTRDLPAQGDLFGGHKA
jgi:hypothetical protein